MSKETWPEQVARLEALTEEKNDWRITDNDRAAIRAVLDLIADAYDVGAVARLAARNARLTQELDEVRAALRGCYEGATVLAKLDNHD